MPRWRKERVIYPSDLALVRAALDRDPAAIRHLADRAACVSGFLRRRAARLGMHLSPAALDDLAQDTYLDLWRKLTTYRGESKLETWACGFAFVQLRRLRERRSRDLHSPIDHCEEPVEESESPDDLVEVVDQALQELGPPADEVIRLKHFESLTFELIASRLRMSPNTAKSHYYRGLAKLRETLRSRGEELIG